jgi:SEC-C motif-containing protein
MANCACGSGAAYARCCAPCHRGEREALDASALMRSRYAAFALKKVDYLWQTLHPHHEDRGRPREAVLAALRDACSTHRYLGLNVLASDGPDAAGIARVLFAARVFRAGRDLSFIELSQFARDDTGWRYLAGHGRPLPGGEAPEKMSIERFLELS